MEFDLFETSYRLINKYNQKNLKPKRYGTEELLYTAEVHMLDVIGKHETITTTKLAELLGITKGAVSQTTNKLLEKGLIEKHPSIKRKNEIHIVLSEKGNIVFDYHQSMHKKTMDKVANILGGLSNESIDAIRVIVDLMDEMLDEI